jgi:hypothetical protein
VDYLDAKVPANTTVQVCSIPLIFSEYVRTDIHINYDCTSTSNVDSAAHYIVITSPKSLDTIPYPPADVAYSVGRDGSIFGVVIKVSHTK